MTYEKHDWQAGEVITEALLDNMEQGIYDANQIVGLKGSATTVEELATETTTDIKNKVNEIITQLKARGITT
jgi:hypothetical protein